MEAIFMNMENRKTNEPHKFVLNLLQRLDLRSSNKHVAFQNLSIYYTQKNIRKQYKNNKLKVLAPTMSDEFKLRLIKQHKKINRQNKKWRKSTKS